MELLTNLGLYACVCVCVFFSEKVDYVCVMVFFWRVENSCRTLNCKRNRFSEFFTHLW